MNEALATFTRPRHALIAPLAPWLGVVGQEQWR